MTKCITSKVTFADTGDELDHDIFEYENQGAGQATLRLRPTDPHLVITRGTKLNAWIGWTVDGEDVLWPKVLGGIVQGSGKTSKAGSDLLELSIDAGGKRFRIAPPEFEERENLTISSLFHWLFVEGCGFDSVITNIDEFDIPDPVHVDPRATWRSVVDPYIAAFSPEIFPQVLPDGTVSLWIVTARQALPEGFPTNTMTVSEWRTLSRSGEWGRVVNAVDILHYTTDLDPRAGEVCTIEEKLVGSNLGPGVSVLGNAPGQPPDGYPRTQTWNRTEKCILPEDETAPPRLTPLGTRTQTHAPDGTKIAELVTAKTWHRHSGNTIPDTERATESGLVRLPGGGLQYMVLAIRKKKYQWWFNSLTGKYRPVSEDTIETAEVLVDSRVKLSEASRNGTTDQNAAEAIERTDTEHERVDYSYGSGGLVTRIRHVTDLLADPPATASETSEDYAGRDSVERTRPTKTTLHVDQESIDDEAIGLRPRETFDGRLFGLDESMRIVDTYVFALQRESLEKCQCEPAPFAPSAFRGELYSVDPDDGGPEFFALATSERHRVDRSNKERPTGETQLALQRLPVAV